MKQKRFLKPAIFILSAITLCSCSSRKEIVTETYVLSSLGTFYETEAFDCVSNGSKNLITYYSAETDKCVPLCTKPNCKHDSDDCTAAMNYSAEAILKTDDGLLFFDYGDEGELKLIKSDYNGSNRETIAAIDNMSSYAWLDEFYSKDSAYCIYHDVMDLEGEESSGDEQITSSEMVDKYACHIDRIDINTGEVTNIFYKKDHKAKVQNAVVYDNKLIYSFQYYTRDIRDIPDREERGKYYRLGVYCLDLETGEEKKLSEGYDAMMMAEHSFNYFDPEKLFFHNIEDKNLYLYNMNTGEFKLIGECDTVYNSFVGDSSEVFYYADSEGKQYTRYNIETGELSSVPRLPEGYNLSCIVGNTVWVSFKDEEGRFCCGWMSKDDFVSGNHNDIKFAYYFNSLDGSVKY